MKRLLVILLVLLQPCLAQTPREKKLSNDVRYLISQEGQRMKAGVAIVHLATGEKVSVDGSRPYPLASVFKVHVLLELARQLQAGRAGLSLEQVVTLKETDRCIGSGTLQHQPAGSKVKIQRCVELMESISDNTATDVLFNRIGTDSVNKMLTELGYKNSDVFMTNRAAYLIALGMGQEWRGMSGREIAARWRKLDHAQRLAAVGRILKENQGLTLSRFQAAENASAAQAAYADDVAVATVVDNLASPDDLADLLGRLYKNELLDKRWTEYALGILAQCKYKTRIPRLLPRGTTVYHKTGTIAGVVNDAGIIRLEDGTGLVVVVLVKDVARGSSDRASTLIAQIAELAYNAYSE
ncbi:MAG: hypothetical protein AMXMBFR33_22690 [Candidatus Xenobia bacterium]